VGGITGGTSSAEALDGPWGPTVLNLEVLSARGMRHPLELVIPQATSRSWATVTSGEPLTMAHVVSSSQK
jgi:hypothetical protein